jgi:hypothetical protein
MARKRVTGRIGKRTLAKPRGSARGRVTARKRVAKKRAVPARPRRVKKIPKSAAKRPRAAAKTQPVASRRKRAVVARSKPTTSGAAARAAHPRHPPALERARRQLREVEENVPTPPSSLDLDRTPSAARSGRHEMIEARLQHNETSPELTGGDVDANWADAYSVGDEAPGGDNPTPDQDLVDDIGKALGVEYQDNEELKAADKIAERDRHRWELDPASSEDYKER